MIFEEAISKINWFDSLKALIPDNWQAILAVVIAGLGILYVINIIIHKIKEKITQNRPS